MKCYCELDERDIKQAIANSQNCGVDDVSVIVEHVTVYSQNERTEHKVKARVKIKIPDQR